MKKRQEKKQFTVDTPWGRLITAQGVLEVFTALEEEVDRISASIKKIGQRLMGIETKLSEDLDLRKLEKKMKEFDEKITEIEARFEQFTHTVKKILFALRSESQTSSESQQEFD